MPPTPKALLKALEVRDGMRSAWTGDYSDTLVPQHRQGGMGGSKFKHRLSNVVWLESLINGLIESDPEWQAEAIRRGIKVSQHADRLLIPVDHKVHGLVLLDDAGGVEPLNGPEAAEWHFLARLTT